MRESKYLRLALVFSDNNASTFKKNLEKMISLILYDYYGKPLTVLEIIEELKNSYGLEFTEIEVLGAITEKRQNRIICVEENKDRSQDRFSITPEAKNAIDEKIDLSIITDTTKLFLSENAEIDVDAKTFENILKKYFYSVFNSNATTISELLDKKLTSELQDDISFSDSEKEQINAFLEWNNSNKDKCVYQMVSCCFDYCMMTVKRDSAIYRNIFRQKKFYLDTNIIFRMMGLNRENRKKLIDTFIKKCNDAGIELRYTNYTRKEIYDTIDHHAEKIKNLLSQSEPISVAALRVFSSKYYNLSFYESYVNWCEEISNKIGDYKTFAYDMKRQANSVLTKFVYKDFDGYEHVKPEEFTLNCESLKNAKQSRRGYAKDEIVKTDINNFMYIREQNNRNSSSNFESTDYYLISADHILGDWARSRRPESVPIVVLPSVWYSIILRYTGRTEDDFASFTRFLNFSLASSEEDDDPRKIAILKRVIELDEPKEIKERTIFDIESKLQTEYKDLDSVEEIVESSHETILNQERARIKAEVQQQADLKIADIEANYKETTERTIKEKESELTQEKTRHARAEFELVEKNRDLLEQVDEARKQGARERAERLAETALPRTMCIYWIIAIFFVSVFVCVNIVLIMKLINGEISWLPEIYEKASVLIDVVVDIIIGILGFLVISKGLCRLNKEAVKKRLIEKYSK